VSAHRRESEDDRGDMTVASGPGACNIGPAERARRRRAAFSTTALALLAAGALLAGGVPQIARLAVLPFAVTAAVTWLQVVRRFCVAFGAAGVQNFGSLGSTERVDDPAERVAHRNVALRMIVEGIVYGAIATAILVLLPV
jgi:hypothetical protein